MLYEKAEVSHYYALAVFCRISVVVKENILEESWQEEMETLFQQNVQIIKKTRSGIFVVVVHCLSPGSSCR